MPDGSVAPNSRLTVDLKGMTSDQGMRDGYIRNRTLETDKFPDAVFVPTAITGVPKMVPTTGQVGVQLTGNLTIHGVTKPVTFKGIATLDPRSSTVAGPRPCHLHLSGLQPHQAHPRPPDERRRQDQPRNRLQVQTQLSRPNAVCAPFVTKSAGGESRKARTSGCPGLDSATWDLSLRRSTSISKYGRCAAARDVCHPAAKRMYLHVCSQHGGSRRPNEQGAPGSRS